MQYERVRTFAHPLLWKIRGRGAIAIFIWWTLLLELSRHTDRFVGTCFKSVVGNRCILFLILLGYACELEPVSCINWSIFTIISWCLFELLINDVSFIWEISFVVWISLDIAWRSKRDIWGSFSRKHGKRSRDLFKMIDQVWCLILSGWIRLTLVRRFEPTCYQFWRLNLLWLFKWNWSLNNFSFDQSLACFWLLSRSTYSVLIHKPMFVLTLDSFLRLISFLVKLSVPNWVLDCSFGINLVDCASSVNVWVFSRWFFLYLRPNSIRGVV